MKAFGVMRQSCYDVMLPMVSCWVGLNFQWSFSYYFRLILNNRQKAVNNSRRSQTLKLSSEVARSHAQIDKVILLLVERSLWIASIFKEYFCFSAYEFCDGEEKCMIRCFFLISNRAFSYLIFKGSKKKKKLKYNKPKLKITVDLKCDKPVPDNLLKSVLLKHWSHLPCV